MRCRGCSRRVRARAHSSRFLMLAATVAFAAAFGSFVGSVSGSGLVRFSIRRRAGARACTTTSDAARQTKLELAELSAIKANLDSRSPQHHEPVRQARGPSRSTRSTLRRGQSRPRARLRPLQPRRQRRPAAPKIADRVLQDWIVQDVQNGRALVESRYGGMFDVGEGSMLPGVGRIDSIKRQDGQWIVLTERGTITSGR